MNELMIEGGVLSVNDLCMRKKAGGIWKIGQIVRLER